MPIIKSAKKALRQSLKRRARNLQQKKKIKNLLKRVETLVTRAPAKGGEEASPSSTSQKKQEEAKKLLPQIYKYLDKTAKTGLVKKNTAARLKSRITKSIFKSRQ